MCAGVSKSGSPTPSPMMSRPSARSRTTRPLRATVGEGLTRLTRSARATGTVAFRIPRGTRILDDSMSDTDRAFRLRADYRPAGDQPQAIDRMVGGLRDGLAHQTLLGVTGSGK